MSTVKKRTRVVLMPEQWRKIKALVLEGATMAAAARKFGASPLTVRHRARTEGWFEEQGGEPKVAGGQKLDVKVSPPSRTPAVQTLCTELLKKASNSPADFQAAVAGIAEILVAEGIKDLEPPRTVTELGKYVDIIRKARGLDNAKGPGAGFVRPVRQVSRTPAIEIEATPESPLDGFEI